MKRFVIQIFIILTFISLAFYFYNKNRGTLSSEIVDFAISDTANVDKIKLTNSKQKSLTLLRVDNKWLIDNVLDANEKLVHRFLTVLKLLEMRMPVPKATKHEIMEALFKKSTQVQIYQHNKLVKTYYVGDDLPDATGAYMILENSDIPLIMHIAGFKGKISSIYSTDPKFWRSNVIFQYKPHEIKRVSMNIKEAENKSFTIVRDEKRFTLYDYQGVQKNKFNLSSVERYLSYFERVRYEYIEENTELRDSIKKQKSIHSISITNSKGEVNKISTFYILNSEKNKSGQLTFDFNKMYALVNNETELVVVRFFEFDPILKDIEYFEL